MNEIIRGVDFSKYYVKRFPIRTAAELAEAEEALPWVPQKGQRVRLTERARTRRENPIDWELVRARFESHGTIMNLSKSVNGFRYAEVEWDRLEPNYPKPATMVTVVDLEPVNLDD